MSSELVSVIIPTFRRNNTLRRAIESVINQTYQNLEIIVVDDNADYLDVREQNRVLLGEYPNITFIENKNNLGGGLSRNEGIRVAHGKYVAFLDDDDEYLPSKIEKQIEAIKGNDNAAVVYCHANMIKTNGLSYVFDKNIEGCLLIENTRECIAATSWWLCDKAKLESVGGFENIASRQDASLLMKFFVEGYDIVCVKEVLLNYYMHDSNNGISKNDEKSVEAEKQYREIFNARCANIEKTMVCSVNYIFCFRIAMQYILIHKRKSAYKYYCEMKNIKKTPDIMSFRTLFGIIFNRVYCMISRIKNM